MRISFILSLALYLFASKTMFSQTLGGSSTYAFLKMPQHPLISSLGGRNISSFAGEAGLVSENPALMRSINNGNISSSFTFLSPGLNALSASGIYSEKKSNTNFGFTIGHIQYGSADQTDASGNMLGTFNPYDQAFQISASRKYGSKWHYGAALKFIHSNYGSYRSSALAADAGLNYFDEDKKIQFGFSAKNMGFQFKTYAGAGEDLPFDMLVGVTKQLDKSPLRFSITAQRIHQFDLLHNDTTFNSANFGKAKKNSFQRKLLSHFIFGTEILIGEKVVLMGGYNFLRSMELRLPSLSNGLAGIGYGMSLKLIKFDFFFSRSHYQTSIAQNQIGITYRLTKNKN